MKMQRTNILTAFALSLGALCASAMGCELIASVDRTAIPEAATGPGGGGGGTTTSTAGPGGGQGGEGGQGGVGGQGGQGGQGGCGMPEDCPPTGNPCVTNTCENNTCGTMPVPDQTPTANQVAGDCKLNVCDGSTGTEVEVDDETDITNDAKECTTDTCDKGSAVHTPVAAGTDCSQNGGKKCNASGACVECLTNVDCTAPNICKTNQCVVPTCSNAMLDGTETDLDCGGPDCTPCGVNKKCAVASDCTSMVCTDVMGTLRCQAASCSDTVQNQGETDVDCGGANCPNSCDNGQKCNLDGDCTSNNCVGGTCTESCQDGIKTGTETDIDCGGASCPDCADGKACLANTDCTSMACDPGTMTCISCTDMVLNGTETDVDCGGMCATKCANGQMCMVGTDCLSNACTGNVCVINPMCSDGMKNQDETDIDCGGAMCMKCSMGKMCNGNADCANNVCIGNVCTL